MPGICQSTSTTSGSGSPAASRRLSSCSSAAPESSARACQPSARTCEVSTTRSSGSSSTTSTSSGRRAPQRSTPAADAADAVSGVPGKVCGTATQNVLPRPGALSRPTSPPMIWASRLTMDSPSPVPP